MDNSWLISAGFGGALLVAGLWMMRSHWLAWQAQKADGENDESDIRFLRRRFRRRMQASGMMALIGLLLPIGDWVDLFRPAPGWFAAYWGLVLLLVMWLFLLAIGDMVSTRAHAAVALNRIKAQQRQLEQEALALRKRTSSGHNGSQHSGPETR